MTMAGTSNRKEMGARRNNMTSKQNEGREPSGAA